MGLDKAYKVIPYKVLPFGLALLVYQRHEQHLLFLLIQTSKAGGRGHKELGFGIKTKFFLLHKHTIPSIAKNYGIQLNCLPIA